RTEANRQIVILRQALRQAEGRLAAAKAQVILLERKIHSLVVANQELMAQLSETRQLKTQVQELIKQHHELQNDRDRLRKQLTITTDKQQELASLVRRLAEDNGALRKEQEKLFTRLNTPLSLLAEIDFHRWWKTVGFVLWEKHAAG